MAPEEESFLLYVPTSGKGPTHLRDERKTGILCGNPNYRYSTFTVAGIVPASSATCGDCKEAAK